MKPAALEWVARFRRYMNSERRLSAHTDSNYARDLAALVKYCDRSGLEEWSALDTQHIRVFAAHSHAGGLSPRSVQRRLSAVRSFYEFLIRENHERPNEATPLSGVRHNPANDVRAPKAAKHLPETLDPDQMARLLDIPLDDGPANRGPGHRSFVLRDRAIMELLYSSGLRLAELVGLDVEHLQLVEGMVRVRGKGDKTRIVPVGSVAVEGLKKCLRGGAAVAKPEEKALFVGRGGKRLGPRAIQTRVAYWARHQGLSTRGYPHRFLHSF